MSQPALTSFEYIEAFSCLADQCPSSCCNDAWRIAVDNEHVAQYQKDYPPIYNILAKDEQGYFMQSDENGCRALDKGLCIIHRDHGEHLLSDTCQNYPRMFRDLGALYTKGGTMSCPEVARLCLTMDSPFSMTTGTLPVNHAEGHGLVPNNPVKPESGQWQQTLGALLALAQDESLSAEAILLTLQKLGPMMESTPASDWAGVIAQAHHSAEETSLSEEMPRAMAGRMSLMIVALEALTRPGSPEVLRQALTTAFTITDHAKDGVPSFQLQADIATHYRSMRPALAQTLKRFIAGEISRTGFPFISTSSAGQDYGHSVAQWTTTLIVRTLMLRTILLSLGGKINAIELPQDMLVEVMYNYCRKVNHLPAGGCEHELRQEIDQGNAALLTDLILMNAQ
ncbi:flagellin lysine-N-methylase [Pokkaliibacter sp. CJK22405]|uniref:flagellin lysine-N-methylase n=1 Tax=Pokkaliibacter sp. CJK22405 TaxID=3384615 RepID=UPI0039854080